jgi:hypothetical protein
MSEPRTTTLVFGPFEKPLTLEQQLWLSLCFAKAFGRGYTLLKAETATHVTLTAIQTAPRTQPFLCRNAFDSTTRESERTPTGATEQ